MRDIGIKIRRLTEGRVTSGDRTQAFIEVAIARALAITLQLPTSPVGEGQFHSHYINRHATNVKDALSIINENFIIDVKTVNDLVMKFYRMRYNMVYEPYEKMVFDVMMHVFSEDSTYIPQNLIETMKTAEEDPEFRSEMFRLMNQIMLGIKEELSEEQESSAA